MLHNLGVSPGQPTSILLAPYCWVGSVMHVSPLQYQNGSSISIHRGHSGACWVPCHVRTGHSWQICLYAPSKTQVTLVFNLPNNPVATFHNWLPVEMDQHPYTLKLFLHCAMLPLRIWHCLTVKTGQCQVHLRFKSLAQGPKIGRLVVLGFEHTTLQWVTEPLIYQCPQPGTPLE